MIGNNWANALRAGLYGALLAASATAALMPGWATTLKAQDYSGYVDLHLDVQVDSPTRVGSVRAGDTAPLLVTLTNAGSADAHRARTDALIEGSATAAGTSGCLEDPTGYPSCTLAAALPAGGTAQYRLRVNVPPLARGNLQVLMAAASDDPESMPGQEILEYDIPIEAHVDLQVAGACNRAYLVPNVPLSCRVTFYNAGPSGALTPYLYINTFGYFSNVSCAASRAELCTTWMPAMWWPATMLPGESITMDFDTTLTPNLGVETWQMFVGAQTNEAEDAPADNVAVFELPVPLFRDGFEADPPPLH